MLRGERAQVTSLLQRPSPATLFGSGAWGLLEERGRGGGVWSVLTFTAGSFPHGRCQRAPKARWARRAVPPATDVPGGGLSTGSECISAVSLAALAGPDGAVLQLYLMFGTDIYSQQT